MTWWRRFNQECCISPNKPFSNCWCRAGCWPLDVYFTFGLFKRISTYLPPLENAANARVQICLYNVDNIFCRVIFTTSFDQCVGYFLCPSLSLMPVDINERALKWLTVHWFNWGVMPTCMYLSRQSLVAEYVPSNLKNHDSDHISYKNIHLHSILLFTLLYIILVQLIKIFWGLMNCYDKLHLSLPLKRIFQFGQKLMRAGVTLETPCTTSDSDGTMTSSLQATFLKPLSSCIRSEHPEWLIYLAP